MDYWKILVLGTIRLNCNFDYDKLLEMANNHITIREMLGHGLFDKKYNYSLQTLKDNVSLLTPGILDSINTIVVESGHKLVKKKEEKLNGRCDSFVVKTNVHYPTDINLLFDSIKKVIVLLSTLCITLSISGWRQSKYRIRKIKKLFRKAQKLKKSSSDNEKKKAERDNIIKEAHQAYINIVIGFLEECKETIKAIRMMENIKKCKILEIEKYISHSERQIDQIQRRVINGEKIPHDEKVFSIFEEHTEWITKGKAGVPQELGLKVCILEDQYGFILHHMVMQKQADVDVAVSMVNCAKTKFEGLNTCSFDKGFYSQENLSILQETLDMVVLCKKGRLSSKDIEIENAEEFIKYRHKHSAVESAINGLENHGLDVCLDSGIDGFKRYVSLSILSRNIQTLGNIIQKKLIKKKKNNISYNYNYMILLKAG